MFNCVDFNSNFFNFFLLTRLKATESIAGIGRKEHSLKELAEWQKRRMLSDSLIQTIGFTSSTIACLESCGTLAIPVERYGAGCGLPVSVKYETKAATAKNNVNFQPVTGEKLLFSPYQLRAEIVVTILDDGIYEERAKFFNLKLSNPAIESAKNLTVPQNTLKPPLVRQKHSSIGQHKRLTSSPKIHIEIPEITVSILDDDHCGVFSFEKSDIAVPDNIGKARLKVQRTIGTKCRVSVPYRITPGTAKYGIDYKALQTESTLIFEEKQFENFIEIEIVDKDRFGEVFNFYIELFPPKKESAGSAKSTVELPRLGERSLVQIGICENEETRQALDRLLKTPEIPSHVVSSNWRDQFRDAFSIYREDMPAAEPGNMWPYRRVLLRRFFIHIISFPWKFILALLPPARFKNGYISYFLLLAVMGVLTAFIGDLATLLACSIGLKRRVTAITLIPLGMGLPDMFASRYAAMNEKYADAAIGSIVGSNAVSVFLGIGLSWSLASIYAEANGNLFLIPPRQFGFSFIILAGLAFVGLLVLLLRRLPPVRGELGGPNSVKYLSALFFIILWLVFVTLSTLEDYCIISSFL